MPVYDNHKVDTTFRWFSNDAFQECANISELFSLRFGLLYLYSFGIQTCNYVNTKHIISLLFVHLVYIDTYIQGESLKQEKKLNDLAKTSFVVSCMIKVDNRNSE